MRFRRTLTAVLAALGVSLGLSTVAAPAFAASPPRPSPRSPTGAPASRASTPSPTARTTTINGWTVAFDLPVRHTIGCFWDAAMTRSGQHFTFTNAELERHARPRRDRQLRLQRQPARGAPTNCTLNGASCAGGDAAQPRRARARPAAPVGHRHHQLRRSRWRGAPSAAPSPATASTRAPPCGPPSPAPAPRISGLGACTVAHLHRQGVQRAGRVGGQRRRHRHHHRLHRPSRRQDGRARRTSTWAGATRPSPATVMSATGIKWFTMAFILSGGGCTPAWDGSRPLTGGADAQRDRRRSGRPAATSCRRSAAGAATSSARTAPRRQALAGAYQQVINAYSLEGDRHRHREHRRVRERGRPGPDPERAEDRQAEQPGHQDDRHLRHLDHRPELLRHPADQPGRGARREHRHLHDHAVRLRRRREHVQRHRQRLRGPEEQAEDRLRLDRRARPTRHMGISGMNGLSDQQELTTPGDLDRRSATGPSPTAWPGWRSGRSTATGRCAGGGVVSNCSGIAQPDWEFTRITAGF